MKKHSKKPLRLTIETIRHLKNTQLAAVNAGADTDAGPSTLAAITCAPCSGPN